MAANRFDDLLEIEGDQKGIKDGTNQLKFDRKKRILLNYLSIFEILKQDLKTSFNDITFTNFKNIRIDLKKYLHQFEFDRS